MNARFVLAAHAMGMLAWAERERAGPLTSDKIAESIPTHPVVVRRLLTALGRTGLVVTRRGAAGGVALGRSAERITLREVYEAVTSEHEHLLGRHPADRSDTCAFAPVVATYLDEVCGRAEAALLATLDAVSVQQFASEVVARMSAARRRRR